MPVIGAIKPAPNNSAYSCGRSFVGDTDHKADEFTPAQRDHDASPGANPDAKRSWNPICVGLAQREREYDVGEPRRHARLTPSPGPDGNST